MRLCVLFQLMYNYLRNINKKLNEGDLTLTFRNESKNIDEKIDMKVVWFNKPMSLLNPEKAIEFLSFIEQDSVEVTQSNSL